MQNREFRAWKFVAVFDKLQKGRGCIAVAVESRLRYSHLIDITALLVQASFHCSYEMQLQLEAFINPFDIVVTVGQERTAWKWFEVLRIIGSLQQFLRISAGKDKSTIILIFS